MLLLRHLVLVIVASSFGAAQAAVVEYLNFADYSAANSALGLDLTVESFETVASDTSFQSSDVTVGDLTFSTDSASGGVFNTIQTLPFGDVGDSATVLKNRVFADSNYLLAGVRAAGEGTPPASADESFTILFSEAVNSFSAFFGGLNNALGTQFIRRTALIVNGEQYDLPTSASSDGQNNGQRTFYGLISDTPFTSVTFQALRLTDGFGVDDIRYGSLSEPAPIPVPASLPLALSALAAFGILRVRRRAS